MSEELLRALRDALPEGQRKHLDPSTPAPMRMMAAKGLAPLPPRELVIVLVGLGMDADAALGPAARGTLGTLPDRVLGPALDGGLPPVALGAIAAMLAQGTEVRGGMLEKLVLNRETPDAAIALLAPIAPVEVAEIIASNQERCLRSEAVVDGIRRNAALPKSSRDRLFDFLVRAGVIYDGMLEVAEAMARLSPQELVAAVGHIRLPAEADVLLEDSEGVDARAEAAAEALETLDTDSEEEERKRRLPVLQVIGNMTVAQRVALATKGNKEARAILVRDRNRIVASAAIRNPRVTEAEVVAAAQSRAVCDEVVRVICRTKEMVRGYPVKKALVYNPKTPLQTAMQFMSWLYPNDLRDIAKSKNVQTAVAKQAKRLLERKR